MMKTNIGNLLRKRTQLNSQREAFVDVDRNKRLTYAQYNQNANRAAHVLLGLGVKQGDRVALLLDNRAEYMEVFFGIAKIGAICVPLNWRLTVDELSFILKDSGAETLIFGDAFARLADELHARGAEATAVQSWAHIGDQVVTYAVGWNGLHAAAPLDEPELAGFEDDPLFIMYTSGTTGLPKGAVHTHNSVMWAVASIAATWDVRQTDRVLVGMPLFHVGALAPTVMSVYVGNTAVVPASFDAARYWKTIEAERVTNGLLVPTILTMMLQVPEKDHCRHDALRWFTVGGAPVPVPLLDAYKSLGVLLQQSFGLTESCGPGCHLGGEDVARKPGSAGRAFLHNNVRIVDLEGHDVAPGERGELILQGKNNMREYWNRPEETAKTLRNGWLHTGDVATMDDEGYVFVVDRIKDMIISGGENVYPAELEKVVAGLAGVTGVAVIGRPDPKWGEVPVAYVERSDPGIDEAKVLDYCADKLARYKIPKAVVFTETLPRTPTGKVQKTALRKLDAGSN